MISKTNIKCKTIKENGKEKKKKAYSGTVAEREMLVFHVKRVSRDETLVRMKPELGRSKERL